MSTMWRLRVWAFRGERDRAARSKQRRAAAASRQRQQQRQRQQRRPCTPGCGHGSLQPAPAAALAHPACPLPRPPGSRCPGLPRPFPSPFPPLSGAGDELPCDAPPLGGSLRVTHLPDPPAAGRGCGRAEETRKERKVLWRGESMARGSRAWRGKDWPGGRGRA